MSDALVLATLARAHRDRFARLAEGTARLTGRLWDRYGPVSDQFLEEWLAETIPVVQAGQQVAASQTIGYLTAYSTIAGVPVDAPEIDLEALIAGVRNGTPPADVYARPTITARKVLSDGRGLADALRIGRARAAETAHTDVMLASRAAEQATMEAFPHCVGYRRVANPSACRYCLLASTQRYHVRDLRPCHTNCNCSVAMIIGSKDPGHVLDQKLHQQLKDAGVVEEETLRRQIARAKTAGLDDRVTALRARQDQVRARIAEDPALRYRSEVAVHEHGELGPVLTDREQHFTTI